MPGDEISRLIHVIFNGDNFSQWSQALRSYLKVHKLWIYVSGDRPIPKKWTKKLILPMPFRLRIEKVLIIKLSLGFVIYLLHPC